MWDFSILFDQEFWPRILHLWRARLLFGFFEEFKVILLVDVQHACGGSCLGTRQWNEKSMDPGIFWEIWTINSQICNSGWNYFFLFLLFSFLVDPCHCSWIIWISQIRGHAISFTFWLIPITANQEYSYQATINTNFENASISSLLRFLSSA